MKLNIGTKIDSRIQGVYKSINKNLKDAFLFESETTDTVQIGTELKPPVPMADCKHVFDNSSYVAKCCRILSKDILLNKLSLTNETGDPDNDNIISKIEEIINDNIDELSNMGIDYYYAGIGVCEYAYDAHKFKLKQIPVNTIKIIQITINNKPYYLLKQQIQSSINYFKIMGEEYPEDFVTFANHKLGECAILGGDNFYTFFATPLWVQERDKIYTEIAISNKNYRTISKGNIATGILHVNLEPQIIKQPVVDENGKIIEEDETREQSIYREIHETESGIAVVFTESNRPLTFDFTNIENNNYDYLNSLQEKAEQATLNCYNIPLARLMINTEKESMNSNKTQSIWEIYTIDLKTEQKKFKQYIQELIYELYSLEVGVEMELPIFSDRRETEIDNLIKQWDKGLLTLRQTIEGLSEYNSVIDLNKYDFTANPDIWEYRKLPEYYELMNQVDLLALDNVESDINAVKQSVTAT